MADNFVFQKIPSEIGMLRNLKSLDLSRDLLMGSLPFSISSVLSDCHHFVPAITFSKDASKALALESMLDSIRILACIV